MNLLAPVVLYFLATGLLLQRVRQSEATSNHAGTRSATLVGLAAVLVHAGVLVHAAMLTGGIDLHFFAAFSLVGFGMAALCALLTLSRPQMAVLGLVAYPLAALGQLLYAVRATPAQGAATLPWQIQLHAWLALLAYATLSLAALVAIMLWLQERALRQRQFATVLRAFPPLTLVESLLFRMIGVGFALLTLALLSGVVFVENLFAQHLVHKTVLSLLAWAAFGTLLFGRLRYGWRGRRAVRLTLTAMGLLALAFFGSKFVLELVLTRAP